MQRQRRCGGSASLVCTSQHLFWFYCTKGMLVSWLGVVCGGGDEGQQEGVPTMKPQLNFNYIVLGNLRGSNASLSPSNIVGLAYCISSTVVGNASHAKPNSIKRRVLLILHFNRLEVYERVKTSISSYNEHRHHDGCHQHIHRHEHG